MSIAARMAEASNYYPTLSEIDPQPEPIRLTQPQSRDAARQALDQLDRAWGDEGLTDAGDRLGALIAELESLIGENDR